MLNELGISLGTAVIILIAFYFVMKCAVRNGIEESRNEISKAVKKGIEESGDAIGKAINAGMEDYNYNK